MQTPENVNEIIEKFISEANDLESLYNAFPDMTKYQIASLFVTSRKYELKRALQLLKDHLIMRKSEKLFQINPFEPGVHKELIAGKFTILKPINQNPRIALFRENQNYRSHNWDNYKDSIKALIFQLDVAVRDQSIQNNGLIVVYNMSEASYNKFDFDLCSRVLKLLKGKYPARLKTVLIVNAPIWFRAPYNVLKLFVSEKMRRRISFVDSKSILAHVSADCLPFILGGKVTIDHQEWLKYCFSIYKLDKEMPNNYFNTVPTLGTTTDSLKCRLTRRMSLQFHSVGTYHNSLSPVRGTKSFSINSNANNPYPLNRYKYRYNQNRRISDPEPNSTYVATQNSNGIKNENKSIFSSGLSGRRIEEFASYIKSLNNYELIGQEFVSDFVTNANLNNNHFEFSLPKNKFKNRYTDVVCLDNNRVILSDSSYIHANYVDSYLQKNAYICCQGPLENTIRDFFLMIFQTKALIVVMTTKEIEGRIKKCAKYIPEPNGTLYFGEFEVRLKDVKTVKSFKVSEVMITDTKTDQIHTFYHYHFTSWPDFGIPDNPKEFLDFIDVVHSHYYELIYKLLGYESELETYYLPENKPPPPPMIIHCSAGIGRTGTFVNVSINQKYIKYEGKVNIKDVLKLIRSQRAGSVQMPQQYIFCYVAMYFYIENNY